MTRHASHDVLVVGAGPVGLLLALDLRRADVDVAVIDARTAPRAESRATTLNARTMQLLGARGLLSRLNDLPHLPSGHFAGLPLPLEDGTPFAGQWKCPQTELEAALIAELDEAGVAVRWGVVLTGLDDTGSEVRADLATETARVELRAGHLVGCDGEDSTVRRLAGIELDGRAGNRRLVRADVTGIEVALRRFEVVEGGMVTAARLPTGETRLMAYRHGSKPDDTEKVDFAEVCELWDSLTGEDISAARPGWIDAFTDAAQWARHFRAGRVVLAGDAGHRLMPAGGLPLNLGLDDAARLAWRLAAIHRCAADEAILDDYSTDAVARARRAALNVGAQAHLLLSENDLEPQRGMMAELLQLESVHRDIAGVVSGTGALPSGDRSGRVIGAFDVTGPDGRSASVASSLRAGRAVLWCRDRAGEQVWGRVTASGCVVLVGEPTGPHVAALAGLRAALVLPDGVVTWTDRDPVTLAEILTETFRSTMTTVAVPSVVRAAITGRPAPRGQRLVGKRCLVTGASRGIGRGIALDLAREGAVVAVHCARRVEQAAEVVAEIQSFGGAAFSVVAAFDDTTRLRDLVAETTQQFADRTGSAQVDVLINNAGVMGGTSFDGTSEDAFDELVRVNVKAPFFLTQEVLRVMPANGRIINISTGLTKIANPDEIAYAMTKGAIEQLTRHLAKGVAQRGITVNAVAPGITDNGSAIFDDPAAVAMMGSLSPFNRVGDPAEIAAAVSFLASDEAGWITGTVVDASGGTVLG
ncbi:SDR family oxidoreductase [Lolliginicoccus levis]|uniref:SDR family oxidoreductase n=1 Tax=Lolliginicoccus levis TaxID=2919542 RepID=UPI00241E4740|nr:SDR family oxidoreductase [Lolliginicoccus levis]